MSRRRNRGPTGTPERWISHAESDLEGHIRNVGIEVPDPDELAWALVGVPQP
ncbi:MAG: hypothetical protein ACRDYX_16430 [Egibacteraceae bacterium]